MKKVALYLLFFILLKDSYGFEEDTFLGCHKDVAGLNKTYTDTNSPEKCIHFCTENYYRFAFINVINTCYCGNHFGEYVDNCTTNCDKCNLESDVSDVYKASSIVVGPPRNFTVGNITDTRVHLVWAQPETYTSIISYKVKALVLKTYSSSKLMSPEWNFSNNTFRAEIVTLHPGTEYNITLQAVPVEGKGAVAYRVVTTQIGEPDEYPEVPKVISEGYDFLRVKLTPVLNNNGPVTSYLVVVVKANSFQPLEIDNLKSYDEAKEDGLPYYIAAEIKPEDLSRDFVVGDGRRYGKYLNVQLKPKVDYHVLLGVKSTNNGVSKVIYSNHTEIYSDVLKKIMVTENEDSPVLIVFLSIAIGLLSVMLLIGVVGFFILKNRIMHRQRQRLNDNQELTFQGPIISLENDAYIPEDEIISTNHYENLNEQVWIIPRNLLNIQHTSLLGQGKFGIVHSGTVHKDTLLKTVAIYSIADGKLQPATKRAMLKDLDLLIRAEKHENVIELVGTCESMDTVCVILEFVSTNLKDLLLGCRNNSTGSFCNVSPNQLLDIAISITKGMAHLESKNIIHKQLCARNISIVDGFTPKIGGFGLAQYYDNNVTPIYTRWTAREVLGGRLHTSKSDVWSFACVLWEICALGATPHGHVSNEEVTDYIVRNHQLKQLPYIGDNLYQLMLNCWQLDLDERPNFLQLMENLYEIKEDKYFPFLNFDLYPGFQYEQYYPNLELNNNI